MTFSLGPFLLVTPACPCAVAPLWCSLPRLVVPWSCRKCCGKVVSLLLATVTLRLSASCFLYWHFCPSFVVSSLLFPPFLTACPSFSSSFFTVTFFRALLLAICKPFSSKVFSLFLLTTCSFGPFLLVTPRCPWFVAPVWHSLSRLVVPWSCRKYCGNVVSLLSATVTLLLSASCFLCWHFCPSFVASSLLFSPFLTACPSFSSSFFTVTFFFALLLELFFRGVCPWYLVPFSFVFSLNDTLSSRDNGRESSFSIEAALLFLVSSLVSYRSVPLVSLLATSEESPEPSGRFLPWENRLVWSLAFSLFFVSDACSCFLSHLSDGPDLKSDGGSWPCVTSLKGDFSTCFCFSLGLPTLRPGERSITPETHSSYNRTVV